VQRDQRLPADVVEVRQKEGVLSKERNWLRAWRRNHIYRMKFELHKLGWNGRGGQLYVLVVLGVCLTSLLSCQSTAPERRFHYGYLPLWADAQQHCVAEYPKESLAQGHQGLAVVGLEIGRDGTPLNVSVLQAPDAAIGRSAQLCANNWRMKPAEPGGPDIRTGKLYFYFVLSSGGDKVYLANDPADKKALVALRL
jgi:TonB family protein